MTQFIFQRTLAAGHDLALSEGSLTLETTKAHSQPGGGLADAHGFRWLAFPLLGTGILGFPVRRAARQAAASGRAALG